MLVHKFTARLHGTVCVFQAVLYVGLYYEGGAIISRGGGGGITARLRNHGCPQLGDSMCTALMWKHMD